MTPYVFLVADNTPVFTNASAVFVPACQVYVFTWQFPVSFWTYFATVSTNMVAHMWNTDRKAMIVRILDALAVVKSMTGLPYRYLRGSEGVVTYQCARHKNATAWIVPFKLKCAKHRNPAARIPLIQAQGREAHAHVGVSLSHRY